MAGLFQALVLQSGLHSVGHLDPLTGRRIPSQHLGIDGFMALGIRPTGAFWPTMTVIQSETLASRTGIHEGARTAGGQLKPGLVLIDDALVVSSSGKGVLCQTS